MDLGKFFLLLAFLNKGFELPFHLQTVICDFHQFIFLFFLTVAHRLLPDVFLKLLLPLLFYFPTRLRNYVVLLLLEAVDHRPKVFGLLAAACF